MGKTTRTYKTPVGAIPKIVNNIEFKTLNQKIFYDIIGEEQTQLVLCHGIAGTGKTYVSIYKALQDVLRRGTGYDKLIIINPTVDVGNEDKLGYLPGELDKKIQQYNESTFTILDKIIGKARAGKMIQEGKIENGVLIQLIKEMLMNSVFSYFKKFIPVYMISTVLLIGLFAPYIVGDNVYRLNYKNRLKPPSYEHIF